MTELLTRPTGTTPAPPRDDGAEGSLWWRGCLAALWAVAVGVALLIVVTLVVWATDSRSGAGAAQTIRVALQLWLAAHKVPLRLHGGGTLAIAPLGLTLGLTFVVARAAAVLARAHGAEGPRGVWAVAAAVGVPYALLTTFVAAAARTSIARPSPIGALAAGTVVGVGAAAWGAARGTHQLDAVLAALPPTAARLVKAGAAAFALVAVAGILLTLGSLAVHASAAADIADGLGGGLIAKLALLVLDALLLPNAAFTVAGYIAGPGFALGAGGAVSVGGAHVAAVPSLPLVAAVPHGAASAPVRLLVIVVLLTAGAVAAWVAVADGETSWTAAVARAVGAGAVAGTAAAALAAVAGGPAGPGRMAVVGASPWQVGLVLAGEVAFVATLGVVLLTWRRRT